jgi:hypothetical protein
MLAVVPEWMSSDFHTFILVDIGWFPKFAERGLGGWFFTNTAKTHKVILRLGGRLCSPSKVSKALGRSKVADRSAIALILNGPMYLQVSFPQAASLVFQGKNKFGLI